jgi:hypothetical protein
LHRQKHDLAGSPGDRHDQIGPAIAVEIAGHNLRVKIRELLGRLAKMSLAVAEPNAHRIFGAHYVKVAVAVEVSSGQRLASSQTPGLDEGNRCLRRTYRSK